MSHWTQLSSGGRIQFTRFEACNVHGAIGKFAYTIDAEAIMGVQSLQEALVQALASRHRIGCSGAHSILI